MSSIHFFPIFYAWTWIPWLMAELTAPRPSVARCAFLGGMVFLVGEPVTAILAVLAAMAPASRRSK